MSRSLEDDLTGLWNRPAFERRLREEVARVRRYRRPCSLCLADLDDFSRINETYGHEAGDEVLREVATMLDTFRTADSAFRVGGDDFAMLLTETDLAGAAVVRGRLERLIADADLHGVTMAMGVAEVLPEDTPDDLLRRVERALYARKHVVRARLSA
jgi:diguanylate cyclase (GGDEF)-like protein